MIHSWFSKTFLIFWSSCSRKAFACCNDFFPGWKIHDAMTLVRHENEIYLQIWQLVMIELEHSEKVILEQKQETQLVLHADSIPCHSLTISSLSQKGGGAENKSPLFYSMKFDSNSVLEGLVNDKLLKIVISIWSPIPQESLFILYFNIFVEQNLLIENGLNKHLGGFSNHIRKKMKHFLLLERCVKI